MAVTRKMADDVRVETVVTQGGFNYTNAAAAQAYDTGVFLDMREYAEGVGIFKMDSHGATDTIQCDIIQATSAAGAGAKALTGAGYAATTIAAAAGTGACAAVKFHSNMLDVDGGFRYVGCRATPSGTAGHRISAHLVRMACHHAAASMPSA